jgi:predicted alpha/beta-hydrolase family hydrolase
VSGSGGARSEPAIERVVAQRRDAGLDLVRFSLPARAANELLSGQEAL